MRKWSKDEKTLLGGIALIGVLTIGFFGAVIFNGVTAEEISREAPAKVAYNYCAQWTPGPKSQTCARYATGYETRIVIHKRGSLWDYETYEVVR
jgi:hypothetical protein